MSSPLFFRSLGILTSLVAAVGLAAACAARTENKERTAYVAAIDGGVDAAFVRKTDLVDEGPHKILSLDECAAAEAQVGERLMFADFEPHYTLTPKDPAIVPPNPGTGMFGGAPAWYYYNDNTAVSTSPLQLLNWGAALPYFGFDSAWLEGTPSKARCDSAWAMHIQGGPFSGYGGGAGSAFFLLKTINSPDGTDTASALASTCMPAPANLPDGTIPWFSNDCKAGLNVSAFDGISFWARRGPLSQPAIRIMVSDRYTSEIQARADFANGLAPACGRVKSCRCGNGRPCTAVADPAATDVNFLTPGESQYCFDPNIDPPIGTLVPDPADAGAMIATTYPACSTTACRPDINTPDALFDNKTCSSYTFDNGSVDELCYNPATDPKPAEPGERCEDKWVALVTLSTEWVFYTIPWSEFAQGGQGHIAEDFGKDAITTFTLGFLGGDVDFYLDDFAFYKKH